MGDFDGLGGIVTGAASGIGRAVTLALAGEGASVLAVDIDSKGLNDTVSLGTGLPGNIVPHTADVTIGSEVRGYVEKCMQEFGSLRFFHNNAGIIGASKSIIDTTEEEWDNGIRIMLRSFFLGLKYVLPVMKDHGGGSIVDTGSCLSLKGAVNRSDYVTAKHGILGLTKTAAAEVAAEGIRVNLICPGATATPMMDESERLLFPEDPTIERRRIEQGTPMGRYGRPEEIANLVLYLLSPESAAYLTGAVISIDGGLMTV